MAMLHTILRRLAVQRRAAAAVEFALVSLAVFGFLLVLINLALAGFDIGLQARATQATARAATVAVANYYATNASYDCAIATTTNFASVPALFDSFTNGALPHASTANGSSPQVTATWYTIPTTNTAVPPGIVLVLISSYNWHPIGFASLGAGFNVKLSTVSMVMGSNGATTTTNCGGAT